MDIDAYLEQRVADGYMTREIMPDGRANYVSTGKVDEAFEARQRALDAWQLRTLEALDRATR